MALCYAEMGSRVSTSGGAYAYVEKAFGPYVGSLANTAFWFGTGILVSAALVNGVAEMISVPFPIVKEPLHRALVFAILLGFGAYINMLGVKRGMVGVKSINLIKLLPLVLLVVVGVWLIPAEHKIIGGFPTWDKLGEATLLLFFTFTGGETSLNISSEMKKPHRTAPLGLMIGVVFLIAFFCLIQIVAQGILGPDLINHKEAPLAAAAEDIIGSWGSPLFIFAALVSILGTLYSILLVFPRVLFAGANDGILPRFLTKIHPRYGTPYWSIIVFAVIAFVIAVSGSFRQLIVYATAAILLMHLGVALAVIRFRIWEDPAIPVSFKIPGGLFVPVLTLVIILWFLSQSKSTELIGIGVALVVLSVFYFIRRKVLSHKSPLPWKVFSSFACSLFCPDKRSRAFL